MTDKYDLNIWKHTIKKQPSTSTILYEIKEMPVGKLLTSLAALQEAFGNPIRKNTDFSDTLYNGTPLLHFFTWTLNSTVNLGTGEVKNIILDEAESATDYYNSSTPKYPETHNVDSLSIMWYLASFGTLVMFFLLISFSEVCCKKTFTAPPEDDSETSPPPYDLFAPPTYDSLFEKKKEKSSIRKKKRKCEVFVINVFGDKNKTRIPSSRNRDISNNNN